MPSQTPLLLGLHAETSIHAGSGASLGVIDLPIQREAHTGYPVVFGSAVKGALRAHAAAIHGNESDSVTALFGPAKVADDSAFAGALLIGDARLAALPIRSLTSQFKWVSCKYLLERLFLDAERLGVVLKDKPQLQEPPENTLFGARDAQAVYLEEYRFAQTARKDMIDKAATILARLSGQGNVVESLKQQLVIARNDDFTHLARAAVPISPHVKLVSTTKTSEDGGLWYEESLPPETLLYVPVIALASRGKFEQEASENANVLRSLFKDKPYLQLGGNETVGMGWCRTKFLPEAVK